MTDSPDPIAHLDRAFHEIQSGISLCRKAGLTTPALILVYSGIDIAGWAAATILDGVSGKILVKESFTKWADTYLKPRTSLGCSALELYGARCGVIHAFTPDSDLYRAGKIRRVVYAWRPDTVEDLRELCRFTGGGYAPVQADSLLRTYDLAIRAKFLPELRRQPAGLLKAAAGAVFTMLPSSKIGSMMNTLRFLQSL